MFIHYIIMLNKLDMSYAKGFRRHNITKPLHDGSFSIESNCDLKDFDNLQLLDEKFIVHIVSASHKHGIMEP